MNTKQTAPLLLSLPAIATIAPPVLIGGAIGLAALWLIKHLTEETTESQPAAVPTYADAGNQRNTAEIPALQPDRSAPAEKAMPPAPKKFLTRGDLAAIFQDGARSLSRTAAVAELKSLGFGKTASYAALSPEGRFSAWLEYAPDGIIIWKS